MASSGLQLVGFFLSLCGVAVTIAATLMVEWKKQEEGKHEIYEGLWMTCSGHDTTTCELHKSLLELSIEVQVTRGVLLLSLFMSGLALLVSTVGMKCTRFMDGMNKGKSTTAMIGGIMFIASGCLTIAVTSWYVSKIVKIFHDSHHHHHHLHGYDFGKAVFVSWAGGLLTAAGGAFFTCWKCWRPKASQSITSSRIPSNNNKSNYV
ncbi:claudin-19-like [Gouania willdenowi]|uniref:Claudin-19-like n=1 Tax=Gouania willdenowi TaxID=441366 RepID=A0A8C5I928_GOUWI|nr:claudin-19-like [Gouania willdenowi]